MSAGRNFAATWRSLQAALAGAHASTTASPASAAASLSRAVSWASKTQAGAALRSNSAASQSAPSSMQLAPLAAGTMSSLSMPHLGRTMLTQRLGSIAGLLPGGAGSGTGAGMTAASPPCCCFTTSTSTAVGVSTSTCTSASQTGGEGGLIADGDSGDDEAPPHRKKRPPGDPQSRRQAQMAMDDPMSRLMASRGMPLGISIDQMASAGAGAAAASGSNGGAQAPEPDYQMEALDDIFGATKQQAVQQAVQQDGQGVDSWGTTRQGPAEIARRLVESNRELEAMAAEYPEEVLEEDVEDELKLDLAPGEAKYRTLEQMSKDIKGLDEVFEVLASVPWLDENDLQQKELKGVAVVGLLGTLEEVGFNIKEQVLRIWAGEKDHSLITDCSEAKDQAALISILFHAKMLEEQYGPAKPFKPRQ